MKQLSYILFLVVTLIFNGCQHALQKRPLKIDALSFQYRTEDSFKGILEAITQKKSTNGRMILRTNPDIREGIYFMVSFDFSVKRIPVGSKIQIAYITNLEPKQQVAEWIIPENKYSLLFQNELCLGITGDKKYSSQTKLIAWKVNLIHPNGQVVTTKHSFAW